MALPAILAGVAAFGSVAGSVLRTIGEQEDFERQEAELERARRLAMMQAADERIRGSTDAGWIRLQGTHAIGQQQLAATRGNIDPGQGTAAQLAGYTRMMSELDAQTEMNNAARRAWGLEQQAQAYGREASAVKQRAQMAMVGSVIGIGASVAQGIGSIAAGLQTPEVPGSGRLTAQQIQSGLAAWEKKWGYSTDTLDLAQTPEEYRALEYARERDRARRSARGY